MIEILRIPWFEVYSPLCYWSSRYLLESSI